MQNFKFMREHYSDYIFQIQRFYNWNIESQMIDLNGVQIMMIQGQRQCDCTLEKNRYISNLYDARVEVKDDGDSRAWLLPYHNGDCCGILIPKSCDSEEYLLTPALSGCSIHIADQDNSWLILHDARDCCNTEEKTMRNTSFSGQNIVSYEYSCSGYRFVKNGIDMEALGQRKDEPEKIGSVIMFYYDMEEQDWVILTNKYYGIDSTGSNSKPVKAIFGQ